MLLAAALAGGCQTSTDNPPASAPLTPLESATTPADSSSTPVEIGTASSGLAGCALDSLPDQAEEVVDDIHAGTGFVAAKDGSTFGNREGLLPTRPNGFYREYTVPTPGESDRGARRIVTGGSPATDPQWYFYTADHYDSFCEIIGAG